MPTAEEIRTTARDSLVGMFIEIDRLSMKPAGTWSERDQMLAQAVMCYVSSMLIGEAYGKPTESTDSE